MARSEQEMIDGLFSRLKEAEAQTGERDEQAQKRIDDHVNEQPGAPYYMAQTILVQEAAIKRLNARVEALEKQKSEKRSSGGFLAGIFGAGQEDEKPAEQGRPSGASGRTAAAGPGQNWQTNGPASNAPGNAMQGGATRGGGFLGGALQTAAGVAGGVMLGNMLMGMFNGHDGDQMGDAINDPVGTDGQNDQGDQMASDDTGGDQGSFEPAGYDAPADGPHDDGGFQDDSSFFGGDAGGFDDFDEL
ncbi:DUF2076 domain-containing protein [Kushneria indalinina]|uniref:Periplasmic ligand-binding sensor protein n=1 Tax=Kushneria indalinina DSM 14324 TaxID=1122140 RepID=A0A3D9DU37_9GAMM|nr:DUF2076 domain-containing protein [Kushneria indalinina]REC94155.1 hypothetical protein C8D72_2524 [Kushneria indalinina DSM 14324]